MSEQFTPGPWACAPTGSAMSDGYSQPFGVIQYNTANLVAGCFGDVAGGEGVAEANARLIAAAPDLYEALAGIKWRSADKDNMEFDGRVTTWQLDAIRAAVAKAKGEV